MIQFHFCECVRFLSTSHTNWTHTIYFTHTLSLPPSPYALIFLLLFLSYLLLRFGRAKKKKRKENCITTLFDFNFSASLSVFLLRSLTHRHDYNLFVIQTKIEHFVFGFFSLQLVYLFIYFFTSFVVVVADGFFLHFTYFAIAVWMRSFLFDRFLWIMTVVLVTSFSFFNLFILCSTQIRTNICAKWLNQMQMLAPLIHSFYHRYCHRTKQFLA